MGERAYRETSATEARVLARAQVLSVVSASRDPKRQRAAAVGLRRLLGAVAPGVQWHVAGFDRIECPPERAIAGVRPAVVVEVATAAMDAHAVRLSPARRAAAWRALREMVTKSVEPDVTAPDDRAVWPGWARRHRITERMAAAEIAAGGVGRQPVVEALNSVREWRQTHDGDDALATSRTRLLCAGAYRERSRPGDLTAAQDHAEVEICLRSARWGAETLMVQHARVERIRAVLREAEHDPANRRQLAESALAEARDVLTLRTRALVPGARDIAIARRLVARALLLAGHTEDAVDAARVAFAKERENGWQPPDGSAETLLILALALRNLGAEHHDEARKHARSASRKLRTYAPNSHDLRLVQELEDDLT